MSQKRDDEQLAPGLQLPSEAAVQRARPIFDRLVGEMRSGRREAPATAGAPLTSDPPRAFGGGRRYDVALSMVAGLGAPAAVAGPPPPATPPTPPTPPTASIPLPVTTAAPPALLGDDDITQVAPANSAVEPTVIGIPPAEVTRTQVRTRPPAGAPTVRQSVQRPARKQVSAEQLLEQTAESARLRTEADGAMAFDITIRDDVFQDLTCTISVNNGRAIAIFRVSDANTRRLLEAEMGRLRAGLEERGLRVEEVKVLQE